MMFSAAGKTTCWVNTGWRRMEVLDIRSRKGCAFCRSVRSKQKKTEAFGVPYLVICMQTVSRFLCDRLGGQETRWGISCSSWISPVTPNLFSWISRHFTELSSFYKGGNWGAEAYIDSLAECRTSCSSLLFQNSVMVIVIPEVLNGDEIRRLISEGAGSFSTHYEITDFHRSSEFEVWCVTIRGFVGLVWV